MRSFITIQTRPLLWNFVIAYNVVGAVDLLGDYYLAIHLGVLENAGRLGATCFIQVVYVPIALITRGGRTLENAKVSAVMQRASCL